MIVDDNKTYRKTLRKLIDEYPQISEVIEAGNAQEMFTCIGNEPPDVVIMDISMPGMDGFEATKKLLSHHSSVKVIILTIYDTDEYRERAKQSGAMTYVVKRDAVAQLDVALNRIFRQKRLL
jgi:DNA-binding NarL/FixJ family response regulator